MLGRNLATGSLAAHDHVGEQQRGKHLGDRTDLENGVGIEGAVIGGVGAAIRSIEAPAIVENNGDESRAFAARVHPLLKNGGNAFLCGNLGLHFPCSKRKRQCSQQDRAAMQHAGAPFDGVRTVAKARP